MALRGGLGFVGGVAVFAAAGMAIAACSDDDSTSSTATSTVDGSVVDVVQPPPPPPPNFPDAPAPPPDLVSRSGFLGNATLIGDVGEPTDGPSWHASDGALYFTVPGSANPLRRLVPGGSTTVVAYADGGASNPVGTATGGGTRLFVTEREAIVTMDIGDAGAVTATSRTNGLGNTVFGDIAAVDPGPSAYFVDTANPRVYRYVAPSDLSLVHELPDAGRTTAIAARSNGGLLQLYVAASKTSQGSAIIVLTDKGGSTFSESDEIDLQGIPANGIAVDTAGRVMVAWARGIDVFSASGGSARPQDGYGMLPIAAVPTSLAFGGADRKTLFVTTAAGKIYSIPVTTAGVPR